MTSTQPMHRRAFLSTLATATAAAVLAPRARAAAPFHLHYLLASSLFGNLPLAEILPVVKSTGADAIDLWPKVHGTQREEIDALGHDRFAEMLRQHGLTLGATTRFDRGPLRLSDEIEAVQKLGGKIIVTGSAGKPQTPGKATKEEVAAFAEKLKPVGEKAAAAGLTVAIENHIHALIESPDSLRWLAELAPPGIGIAFAPFHLPQDPALLAGLIRGLDPKLALFYAWQHGKGASAPISKDDERLQLPGRGPLDFRPLLAALRDIHFTGPTEIFMHPTPRGQPIAPTAAEVATLIAEARAYLERLLTKA
jgi:sugar phosphate isomerase/epimerase